MIVDREGHPYKFCQHMAPYLLSYYFRVDTLFLRHDMTDNFPSLFHYSDHYILYFSNLC